MADESRVEMAARHVAEQAARIERQIRLLERLRQRHVPTRDAEWFLGELRHAFDEMQDHLRMLQRHKAWPLQRDADSMPPAR
jgi:DNA-binding transcriptional LysR family regulator